MCRRGHMAPAPAAARQGEATVLVLRGRNTGAATRQTHTPHCKLVAVTNINRNRLGRDVIRHRGNSVALDSDSPTWTADTSPTRRVPVFAPQASNAWRAALFVLSASRRGTSGSLAPWPGNSPNLGRASAKPAPRPAISNGPDSARLGSSVSYTHLTLPTSDLV